MYQMTLCLLHPKTQIDRPTRAVFNHSNDNISIVIGLVAISTLYI